MYCTTKLSPSVFRPVSLRYTTMRGHTPTMLLTTSTRDGIDSSPVMMARQRLERDTIQSRFSAPFSRVTLNSVFEKGSKDPKTEEDTFCKHRFKRRRSKMGYSTNLCEYPLPKYSMYVSANRCYPPETATRDANYPLQTQLTQALIARVWHQRQNGPQHSQQTDGKCPSPTSAWRPETTRHAPRLQGCRKGEPLPSQRIAAEFGAAFH